MNCTACLMKKFNLNTSPYDAYLCVNGHLQCMDCNTQTTGRCKVCTANTTSVQLCLTINASSETQKQCANVEMAERMSLSSTQHELQTRLSQALSNMPESYKLISFDDDIVSQQQVSLTSHLDKQQQNTNKPKKKIMIVKSGSVTSVSDLRFMQSSESMKNYYSGGTLSQPPAEGGPKVPHGFAYDKMECRPWGRGTGSDSDKSEESVLVHHSYGYIQNKNKNKNNGHTSNCCQCGKLKQENTMARSIGVSTDSKPSLLPHVSLAEVATEEKCDVEKFAEPSKQYISKDFFILHSSGIVRPIILSSENLLVDAQKIETLSMDTRMQKVLETITEEPCQEAINNNPVLKKTQNVNKIPVHSDALDGQKCHVCGHEKNVPATKALTKKASTKKELTSKMSSKLNVASVKGDISNSVQNEDATNSMKELVLLVSQTCRAHFQRPSATLQPMSKHRKHKARKPLPQFQVFGYHTLVSLEEIKERVDNVKKAPVAAYSLRISRAPIYCPITTCQKMIFISDLSQHLCLDHVQIPMERIKRRQCRSFFLDTRVTHKSISRCQMLFLLRGKISKMGTHKFKDTMPLLVMSTRISLADILDMDTGAENIDFLMIWVTGIQPEDYPLSYSLTAWSRTKYAPAFHSVKSSPVYCVRKPKDHMDIFRSGNPLLLPASSVYKLTNDGVDMLELQLTVH